MIYSAGNYGGKIRSDCSVELQLKESGGRSIEITSKVKSLFGKQIEKQIVSMLDFYNIEHIDLKIFDSGALSFVIAARVEAAIVKAKGEVKPYLQELIKENQLSSAKDRDRRSRLYLPGNSPSLMINAGIHHADGLILDLEDAVAPSKKMEARYLLRNALRQLHFYGAERMVRINQLPLGLEDLEFVVPHHVNLILLPKCESPSQIETLNIHIEELKEKYDINYDIWIMPIIESALGVERAFEIACSAENICALAIGLEDFTADLGIPRTSQGDETMIARSRLVNACKAAGIQAIDSVFSDVQDMEALDKNVRNAKSIGFDGMGCIHPRQIRVIHDAFAPSAIEIEKAQKIVNAFMIAEEKGLGVVSLGSKMIDAPVVKRARKVIATALKQNLIEENWRNSFLS